VAIQDTDPVGLQIQHRIGQAIRHLDEITLRNLFRIQKPCLAEGQGFLVCHIRGDPLLDPHFHVLSQGYQEAIVAYTTKADSSPDPQPTIVPRDTG
jgi:hypothetical protein